MTEDDDFGDSGPVLCDVCKAEKRVISIKGRDYCFKCAETLW
jgi:hypothetical protein